jgi:hypothetical protein
MCALQLCAALSRHASAAHLMSIVVQGQAAAISNRQICVQHSFDVGRVIVCRVPEDRSAEPCAHASALSIVTTETVLNISSGAVW